MEISTTLISVTILVALQISLSAAVNCDDKPDQLEFMDPETCWFGPAVTDYNAMFECESHLVSQISSDAYKPDGQACVMDCMLQDGDVIKDMKLDRQKFIDDIKNRSPMEFDDWKSAIEKAADKCFPLAEAKLATLKAADFDDTKKCNPIPKKLMTCVGANILINAPNDSGAINDMYCTKLKDFYKTCDFVF